MDTLPEQSKPYLRASPSAAYSNKKGDIFGGWVMSQMDIAGSILAHEVVQSALSTVAVKELQFLHPLFVDDDVQFFAKVIKIGTTSITIQIDAYAVKHADEVDRHIATGIFVYVAVSAPGKKKKITCNLKHD